MANLYNFGRRYTLAFGKAGQVGSVIGDVEGVSQPLHISFDFEKDDTEAQNVGKIQVYNLNPQHLAELSEGDCSIVLSAGYERHISPVFIGVVTFVSTSLEGADKCTEIEVTDSLVQMRDTHIALCYTGKVSWKKIFDDVAFQMGVAISFSHDVTFSDVSNGFSYVGSASNILYKGCCCCGLEWSIQNGVLQVKRPGGVMNKEVYLLNAETGLLGVPTRVVMSKDQLLGVTQTGWDVTYFLNGAIGVNDFVRIESKAVSGYFRVKSVVFRGDNFSGDWVCTARLVEVTA